MSATTLHRFRPLLRAEAATGFDHRLIVPMILGAILNPVNSSILAVALVPIGIAFGAPAAATAWLVTALYLATAVGQPICGRLIDLFGPRRLYLTGAALIGVGGLLGTLAPSLPVLVLARVVIGFGTCAGYPAAMSLIRRESTRTGRASPASILTVLAVSTQTVVVIGPTVGGLLMAMGGWRAGFAVNLPLALAALVLGARRLRSTAPDPDARSGRGGLDLPGFVLFAVTLLALLLFLTEPAPARWYLPVLAVATGGALVFQELRAAAPFLDLRVLGGNRPLLATYARALLTAITSYALLYGYTQWLEQGRGLSAAITGLLLLPIFATGILVSVVTGRRSAIRGKLAVGAIGQVAVAVLLLLLGPSSLIWLIVLVALVAGIPQGLVNLANQTAVYHQTPAERIGSSAGLLRTFFYLGAIIASTANGIVLSPVADTRGLHALALVMLAAAALFLAITVADRSLSGVGGRAGRATSASGRSPGTAEIEAENDAEIEAEIDDDARLRPSSP